MQNVVTRQDGNGKDKEVVIFNEYTDLSGFVVREMMETKNEAMRFQAGRHVMKPMRLPVYKYITERVNGEDVKKAILTHHVDGDDIQKFELHGAGRTKEEALDRASNKLLRREVEKHQTRRELVACGIGA
jgi:hypothetical protein